MSNKHDANVRKTTFLNFQIGLVASLLFTYVMFEVYTVAPNLEAPKEIGEVFSDPVFTMDDFVIEKTQEKIVQQKKVTPVIKSTEFVVKKDDDVLKEFEKEFKSETSENAIPFNPDALPSNIEKEGEEPVFDFKAVEFVPVFPGCERLETNKERAACFSDKIKKLVSKKFNGNLAVAYGLTGVQRINVQFEVGADGIIRNIKARAPHKALQKEAIRVAGLFPVMKPGMQRDIAVKVVYNLPIVFRIQN